MAEYHYKRKFLPNKSAYDLPNPDRDKDLTMDRPIQPCEDIKRAIGMIVKIEGSGEDFTVTTPEELDAAEKTAMDKAVTDHEKNLSV